MKDGRRFEGQIAKKDAQVLLLDTMVAGIRAQLELSVADIADHVVKPLPEGFFGDNAPAVEAPKDTPALVPILDQRGRFGFVSAEGEVAVSPQFDFVLPYSEGLAAVVVQDRVGYIDPKGTIVINPRFKLGEGIALMRDLNAVSFSEGIAAVRSDGKVGFIDRRGEFRVKPTYDTAGPLVEGLAYARERDRSGYIDARGRWQIDLKGGTGSNFVNGMAAATNDGKWGYINKTGRFVIKPQFDLARPFSGELAAVRVGDRWGFIDRDGRFVVNPRFEFAWSFSEGHAAVVDQKKLGFIDQTGKIVIDPAFDVGDVDQLGTVGFTEGYARVVKDGKFGFIEPSGKAAFGLMFDWASDFRGGLACIRNKTEYHWINRSGKTIYKVDAPEIPKDMVVATSLVEAFGSPMAFPYVPDAFDLAEGSDAIVYEFKNRGEAEHFALTNDVTFIPGRGFDMRGGPPLSTATTKDSYEPPLTVEVIAYCAPDNVKDIGLSLFGSKVNYQYGGDNNGRSSALINDNRTWLKHEPIVANQKYTIVISVDAQHNLRIQKDGAILLEKTLPADVGLRGPVTLNGGAGHVIYTRLSIRKSTP